MYDPPVYVWVLTIGGPTAIAAAACLALYGGAVRAGLGDIAAGIAAPLVALRLAQGTGRRAAVWFNAYSLTDLAVGMTLGALAGYGLLHVAPSSAPISHLPLALVITADVPLMIALSITSLVALARTPRPAPPAGSPQVVRPERRSRDRHPDRDPVLDRRFPAGH